MQDYTYILRSKNAGPFCLTFDLIFKSGEDCRKVVESRVLTPERIAQMYGCRPEQVQIFVYEQVSAVKVSIPRRYSSGDICDTDVFGAQQHVPLMMLEVP